MYTFEYTSILDNSLQTIKIDISLKNNLQLDPVPKEIQAQFIEPVLEEKYFQIHTIHCINLQESLAEKLRAALTRWTPAIRDFFDIWYIKEHSDFNFKDQKFLDLVDIKLAEQEQKYSLDDHYENLVQQIETDLEPVLYKNFDFNFQEIYTFILTFKR